MRPDTHATLEVEAPPRPALDAGPWVPPSCLGLTFPLHPGLPGCLQCFASRKSTAHAALSNGPRTIRKSDHGLLPVPRTRRFHFRCAEVYRSARRCNGFPGPPSLERLARAYRLGQRENRSSFGQVLVKLPAGGPARRLDTSGRVPRPGDKRCQKVPSQALATQHRCVRRTCSSAKRFGGGLVSDGSLSASRKRENLK